MAQVPDFMRVGTIISVPLGDSLFARGLVTHVSQKVKGCLTTFELCLYHDCDYDESFVCDFEKYSFYRIFHGLSGNEFDNNWRVVNTQAEIPESHSNMPYFFNQNTDEYCRTASDDPMVPLEYLKVIPEGAPVVPHGVATRKYIELKLRSLLAPKV